MYSFAVVKLYIKWGIVDSNNKRIWGYSYIYLKEKSNLASRTNSLSNLLFVSWQCYNVATQKKITPIQNKLLAS